MKSGFNRFARYTAYLCGTASAFIASVAIIVVWGVLGPFYAWSDTWQLWANTGTTVITFWMVFVIQHTQNKDTAEIKAMLRQICEDIGEVDEMKARDRAEEEEKP